MPTLPVNAPKRNSNIELLRIVAMVFVMVVHASFKAIGIPSIDNFNSDLFSSLIRIFGESISIICVNIFVLISGWFGIKIKRKRISEFLFQIVFIVSIMYICFTFINGINIEENYLKNYIKIFIHDNYWFTNCYIILIVFSPILNKFVESNTRHQVKLFIITFFSIQTILLFLNAYPQWFNKGYSPLSFIGLYILARYLHIYPNCFTNLSRFIDSIIFLLAALTTTLIALMKIKGGDSDVWLWYSYNSPLVIIQSLFFFLFFSKIHIESIIVNWVAISCFSVYLVHCNPLFLEPIYIKHIVDNYRNLGSFDFFFNTSFWLFFIFILSILLDKVRIIIWNSIYNYCQAIKSMICSFF